MFLSKFCSCRQNIVDADEVELLVRYPPPMAAQFVISPALMAPTVSKQTYRDRMQDLLFIEEMAQFSSIAKYALQYMLLA